MRRPNTHPALHLVLGFIPIEHPGGKTARNQWHLVARPACELVGGPLHRLLKSDTRAAATARCSMLKLSNDAVD